LNVSVAGAPRAILSLRDACPTKKAAKNSRKVQGESRAGRRERQRQLQNDIVK
jgi:hypothetical protein